MTVDSGLCPEPVDVAIGLQGILEEASISTTWGGSPCRRRAAWPMRTGFA